MPTKKSAPTPTPADPTSTAGIPGGNRPATPVKRPAFGDPKPTADPGTFVVKHPSDGPYYDAIDAFNKKHGLHALPFDPPRGGVEPVLALFDVLGQNQGAIDYITQQGKIVFHSTGDCGNVKSPVTQNLVVDKMNADFTEAENSEVPQFHLLLGDVVYSFGEVKYYYDQFYEPYRDYPAPILAAAGNHDAMVAPGEGSTSLEGFLRNFCATDFEVMPEAGGLSRTAQIQPGVFFTFEAPFVTIVVLYSNALEDPGVIADSDIGTSQLDFLRATLTRLKSANYSGALLFAHHHPAYTLSRHGWSVDMQNQIDDVCDEVGLWPHADLAGHAHNYQRFTRHRSDGTHVPYIVCGNGGHNVQRLSPANASTGAIRAPQVVQQAAAAAGSSRALDQIVFENYDDGNYGYLRIVATPKQLHIEYHPASDGAAAKTPDDQVTIDLETRTMAPYDAPTLAIPSAAKAMRATAAAAQAAGKGAGPAAPAPRHHSTATKSAKKAPKKPGTAKKSTRSAARSR